MEFFKGLLIAILAISISVYFTACSDSDDIEIDPTLTADTTVYFVAIEAATDPTIDVLSPANSLNEGVVSPINNGYELTGWTTVVQGLDQIIVYSYTSAPEFVSYDIVDGELLKGESFFIEETPYAFDVVDQSNLVMVTSPRSGFSDKKIYLINTDDMSISKSVPTNFGDIKADSLLAFPTDMKVRDNKLFVSYYHIHANGNFSTPASDIARVAVFSYPELEFEKLITDERAPNIGRYYSTNSLEIAENGDIYTYSSSSLACGYAPVPSKNSAVLRIKNGETEFDSDFYIDFETLSGGFKINDLFYAQDGKAVVRVLKEDESDEDYLWATYAPTSATPLLSTGVLDLNAGSFTLLNEVPNSGGGWNAAHMIQGAKVYLGVSNHSYAGIYVIDTENNTAEEGATIDGNYCKAIVSLSF